MKTSKVNINSRKRNSISIKNIKIFRKRTIVNISVKVITQLNSRRKQRIPSRNRRTQKIIQLKEPSRPNRRVQIKILGIPSRVNNHRRSMWILSRHIHLYDIREQHDPIYSEVQRHINTILRSSTHTKNLDWHTDDAINL